MMKVKAAPPNRRSGPGIANFQDQYLFCGGGYDNDFNDLKSIDMYKIESNTWTNAPELNQKRQELSMCTLGETLYAMFGYTDDSGNLGMIESLNVS